VSAGAWAIGDPQTTFAQLTAVLRAHDLLDDDGALRPGVALLSVGDHFDFGSADELAGARRAGVEILRWLDAQDDAHVLLGNHDISRVTELARFSDERFAAARAAAAPIEALRKERGAEDPEVIAHTETFLSRFPDLPTTEIADRDYSAFTEEQRALVVDLLLRDRVRLACVAQLPSGRDALVTHASVTRRELDQLGVAGDAGAHEVARALNAFLRARVEAVRDEWEAGEHVPLDLTPVHLPGRRGEEGGGLLYHRPTNYERPGADPDALAWQKKLARRYAPTSLPRGLVQVCGHVSHKKCLEELRGFDLSRADEVQEGHLRKLVVAEGVAYGPTSLPEPDGAAVLWLIDGGMNRVAAADYQLLPLTALVPVDP